MPTASSQEQPNGGSPKGPPPTAASPKDQASDPAPPVSLREADEIFDVALGAWPLRTSQEVQALFAALNRAARDSGRRWYMLFDHAGARIFPEAWITFAQHEKHLTADHAHSVLHINRDGAPLAASDVETMARRAEARGAAEADIARQRAARRPCRAAPAPSDELRRQLQARLELDREAATAQLDLDGLEIPDSPTARSLFAEVERMLSRGGPWRLTVQDRAARIAPSAWVTVAHLKKRLQDDHPAPNETSRGEGERSGRATGPTPARRRPAG